MASKLRRALRILAAGSAIIGLVGYNYVSRLNPPGWYSSVWGMMKDCVKVKEPTKIPRYFEVKGNGFPCFTKSHLCVGFSTPYGIFIAQSDVKNPDTVAHEMLHRLGLDHGEKMNSCLDGLEKKIIQI